MSHKSSQADGRNPTSYEKAAANLVAGVILGVGQLVRAIFRTVFQILTAFA